MSAPNIRSDHAQTMAEYAVVLAVITAAITAALVLLSAHILVVLQRIAGLIV